MRIPSSWPKLPIRVQVHLKKETLNFDDPLTFDCFLSDAIMAPSGLDGQIPYTYGPMGPPPQQTAGTFPRGKKSQCESPTYSFSTLSPTSMSSATAESPSGSSYSSSSSSSTTVSYRKRSNSESSILVVTTTNSNSSKANGNVTKNSLSTSFASHRAQHKTTASTASACPRMANGRVYAKDDNSAAALSGSDREDRAQQLSVVATGLPRAIFTCFVQF